MQPDKNYRLCVVGVFINKDKKILNCKRKDLLSWQLPQGGVEKKETFLEALKREMFEEVGISNFKVQEELDGFIYYDFPDNLNSSIAKNYKGQKQKWFLLEWDESYKEIDFSKTYSDEFVDAKWENLDAVIEKIVPFKKEAYLQAFASFKKKELFL